MSYERMPARAAALQAEIAQLLAEAEALDQADAAEHGSGRGDELPA